MRPNERNERRQVISRRKPLLFSDDILCFAGKLKFISRSQNIKINALLHILVWIWIIHWYNFVSEKMAMALFKLDTFLAFLHITGESLNLFNFDGLIYFEFAFRRNKLI